MKTKNFFLNNIKNSFNIYKKIFLRLSFVMFVDALFIVVFFALFFYFFQIIMAILRVLIDIIANADTTSPESMINAFGPEFLSSYKQLILFIFLFLVSMYLIYCILQGLSFNYTHNLFNKKFSYLKLYLKFFPINLLWFIIATTTVYYYLSFNVFATINPLITNTITIFVLLVTSYFAFVSYAMIYRKNTLKNMFLLGVKKIRLIAPVFFIILLLFLTLFFLFYLTTNYFILSLIIIVLALPVVSFSRVYLIETFETFSRIQNSRRSGR